MQFFFIFFTNKKETEGSKVKKNNFKGLFGLYERRARNQDLLVPSNQEPAILPLLLEIEEGVL